MIGHRALPGVGGPDVGGPIDVLVIESSRPTGEFLCDQLLTDGWAPRLARTAKHAAALGSQRPPDLVLLGDLEAPRDSLALIDRIRAGTLTEDGLGADVPLILLSGRRSELDVLRGFDAGADDYLPKPLGYPELRARIRALMRRVQVDPYRPGSELRIGPLVIDAGAHRVTIDGRDVELCKREYELLAHLAREPTRVFTKQELLRDVWGFRAAGATRTLDSHACRLRRKLAAAGPLVVNVWGVGYCLCRPLGAAGRGDARGLRHSGRV